MDARRTLIADAALAIIGRDGIRGLTHLAVDGEAGLPKGSTSYYCRKRVDLLRLALQRLHALDLADLTAVAEALHGAPRSHAEVADAVAGLIVDWLTPPARARTIARFELFLAASHEPDLAALLVEQLAPIVSLGEVVGQVADPPATAQHPLAVLMLAEGLMLSVVRQNLPTPSREQVAALLATLSPRA